MPASARDRLPAPGRSLRCKDYLLPLHRHTHLMGILNVTPDSFSDGGRFLEPRRALEQALRMVREGAHIIDVGAESSRPGARALTVEEESARLLPVLKLLCRELPVPISVDTCKAEMARRALELGVQMINDIRGLADPRMAPLIARHGAAVVIMHMQGEPRTMQRAPRYDDLLGEICSFLGRRVDLALESGIAPESIVVDPGIGFGKSLEHNLQIIKHLGYFKRLGKPILLGSSRKSFIGKVLDLPVAEREFGTAATLTYAILQGARILRVHDVGAMSQVVRMTDAIGRVD